MVSPLRARWRPRRTAAVLLAVGALWSGAAAATPAAAHERARLERHVAEAAAVGRALGRVQNDWAGRVLLAAAPADCREPLAADRAARARLFGQDWRRRLDELAAELDGVRRDWGGPGLDALAADLDRQRAAYLASARWQARLVEPWARDCTLGVLPGPGPAEPGGPLATHEPVAIIGLGGMICPAMTPASGAVVVVDGPACADTVDGCDCQPHPVLPGGALAP